MSTRSKRISHQCDGANTIELIIVNRNNNMVRKAGSRDRICYCLAIIEIRVHKGVIHNRNY